MRVFLNPQDLLKMRRARGLEHNQQLLDQGLIVLDRGQRDLLLPRILFRKTSGLQFCPFLENRLEDDGTLKGLCGLHPDRKPLVCALAPTARELDLETGGSRFYFQEPVKGCPGCLSEHPYFMNRLFPQIEEELELEREYLMRLNQAVNRGDSSEEILKRIFNLHVRKD